MAVSSKFLRVFEGETFSSPPIWFMRQAGRYLPEYRKLRAQAGSFLDLCFDPALASEVTLQPVRRFDLDAAILFADILLIPHALGQKLSFVENEGPKLDPPVSLEEVKRFRDRDVLEPLAPVFETVSKTKAALSKDKALIGFAGAPWTVATYMMAGGPMKDPGVLRQRFYEEPEFVTGLIDVLADKTIDYLIAQIDAGADAVQLFDTWAGGLPWPVLDAVSVRPLDRISRAVKKARPDTPVILFPKGVGEKATEYALLQGCDGYGVDYAMDPGWARGNLGERVVVQGGLDPLLVIPGGKPMEEAADVYLKLFHDVPYIFNLGHGFTPQTPPEHVAALVDFVRRNG
ncbi:uroporphyrinogen decarboxylase [Hyphococcus luteus]|uniref:Uroporphyrinogen decarboxylase n=1 Tax=Hyphococcus luteus TaxID=2058213 RepID=A0A2S7K6S0_9PROT|nr:uroporphyrinogen decarboxylase [Marinicaulis flavus]PQA88203.1 uroporphyrinogen decarboxylase [Marinicaulis flavus]